MAKRIRNFSSSSYKSNGSVFDDVFCKELMQTYFLRCGNDEGLKTKLDRVYGNYEAVAHLDELRPSNEELREAYKHISKLSAELYETLGKLSFPQKYMIAGDAALLNMTELSTLTTNLQSLRWLSEIARKEVPKEQGSPPTKNATLEYFCNSVGNIYIECTAHRAGKKGVTKAGFCIACCDQANIDFRGDSKADDESRMNKLLNPTRNRPSKS